MLKTVCLLAILAASTMGCAHTAQPDADRIVLYAVTAYPSHNNSGPNIPVDSAPKHDPEQSFIHGNTILGQVELTGTNEGEQLADILETHVERPQGPIAGCFNPRHALRVVRDGQTIDYVICFECTQFIWYLDGSDNAAGTQFLSDQYRDRFTTPLTNAGIELAE